MLSVVVLVISTAFAIFGRHGYQKNLVFIIGSGVSLILSVLFAVIVEKTQIIKKFLPLDTPTINDWLDRTAIIIAAAIIYLSFVIGRLVSNMIKSH